MSDPLLSVDNLGLSVRDQEGDQRMILKGVGFDIRPREAVALVGESGSGKSMTARTVMRLLPEGAQTTGQVRFKGESVGEMGRSRLLAYRRSEVAMIFQDPRAHIDPTRSIGDYLIEQLLIRGNYSRKEARARATELLESVRITQAHQRLRQYPHELSGGMLQRTMIAGALAAEPELLLADEPTTALDVTVQAEILRILADLRAERDLAMLFISHDLALAERSCDRMVVMYAGRVLEASEGAKLSESASHPYTIGLMRSRPSIDHRLDRLESLAGRPIAAAEVSGECVFAGRCPLVRDECRAGEPDLRLSGATKVACIRCTESRDLLVAAEPKPAAEGAGDPGATAGALIEATDLRREFAQSGRFGRQTAGILAVDGVSFTVGRGESMALVGESGSGKTTIARMLVGLDRPSAGVITIDGRVREGQKLKGLSRQEGARAIQIVFQDPYLSLDPHQTVSSTLSEVVRFATQAKRADLKSRVTELAEQVGLDPALLDRHPRALSGGQRQRVAIARALASEPSVLVLDEATASLDASIQAQILNLLGDLRARLDLTYVFITHDLSVVRQIADTVIVLNKGKVVERGPVPRVLDRPEQDYTRKLLASVPARMSDLKVAA
jgi:peptide/nickel transport system ATP-binding protein